MGRDGLSQRPHPVKDEDGEGVHLYSVEPVAACCCSRSSLRCNLSALIRSSSSFSLE